MPVIVAKVCKSTFPSSIVSPAARISAPFLDQTGRFTFCDDQDSRVTTNPFRIFQIKNQRGSTVVHGNIIGQNWRRLIPKSFWYLVVAKK